MGAATLEARAWHPDHPVDGQSDHGFPLPRIPSPNHDPPRLGQPERLVGHPTFRGKNWGKSQTR